MRGGAESMHEDLQKQGALARAAGRSLFDNPYLKSENMPAATGDTIEDYQAKHDAWHLGWTIENAMRRD